MITTDRNAQLINGVYYDTATYYGLSTDTKPAVAGNGSAFIEMDTGKVFFFDAEGAAWIEWGA